MMIHMFVLVAASFSSRAGFKPRRSSTYTSIILTLSLQLAFCRGCTFASPFDSASTGSASLRVALRARTARSAKVCLSYGRVPGEHKSIVAISVILQHCHAEYFDKLSTGSHRHFLRLRLRSAPASLRMTMAMWRRSIVSEQSVIIPSHN